MAGNIAPPPISPDLTRMYECYDHLNPPIGSDGTPYAFYEALRDAAIAAGQPVGWSERHGGFWVVTGHAECEAILRDPEGFSSAGVIFPKYAVTEPLMLAEQDEPAHMRSRRLVNLSFMPKSVGNFREAIAQATHDLIDGFCARGRGDVGRIVADPVPAILTAVLLGFPPEDGPRFDVWTTALTHEYLASRETAEPKIAEMYAYFEANIARRQREPGNDVLSQVINTRIDGEALTREELLGFSTVLLIGGIENSAKLIGSALWRLGWDVELRRRLLDDPALIPPAVEEFLRFYTPGSVGRIVTRETSIAGKILHPGQQVMLALQIANRDPRVFPNPDAFAFNRDKNGHLALGSGLHVCLGQHLIRLEATIVIAEFLKRIPQYRIDETAPLHWTKGQVGGMSRVPILFEPQRPRGDERGPGVDAWLHHATRP